MALPHSVRTTSVRLALPPRRRPSPTSRSIVLWDRRGHAAARAPQAQADLDRTSLASAATQANRAVVRNAGRSLVADDCSTYIVRGDQRRWIKQNQRMQRRSAFRAQANLQSIRNLNRSAAIDSDHSLDASGYCVVALFHGAGRRQPDPSSSSCARTGRSRQEHGAILRPLDRAHAL